MQIIKACERTTQMREDLNKLWPSYYYAIIMQIKVGYSACVNKPWATSGLVGCWLQIFKSAKGNFLQSFQTAKTMSLCKNYGEFHLYLFPFTFPFNYIAKLVSSGISSQSWYGVLLKTRNLFWSYLFWGSAKWTFNYLRCHSSSTALGTRNDYWKPTRKGTNETPPLTHICLPEI